MTYMIYDFKTSKCWDGFRTKEQAQEEINSWNDQENYDLHIIPTTDVEEETKAELLIFSLLDKDSHFTTVADFTNEDMLNTDLVDYGTEEEPIKVYYNI